MNQNIKEKWVAALRSGEYEQGTAVLTQEDEDGNIKHCCLGVLCQLALADGVDIKVDTSIYGILSYDDESTILPESVMHWAGVGTNPWAMVDGGMVLLSGLNDGRLDEHDVRIDQHDFNQIADIIEEGLA